MKIIYGHLRYYPSLEVKVEQIYIRAPLWLKIWGQLCEILLLMMVALGYSISITLAFVAAIMLTKLG